MRSARSKGKKDPEYLAWIRTLPCSVSAHGNSYYNYRTKRFEGAQKTVTEAAHVGDRGLSQKCSDREAIPLCVDHHRTGKDAHHVLGKKFWDHHGLDKADLIRRLNESFDSNQQRRQA